MLVLMNHRELTTESNKTRLSIIRFFAFVLVGRMLEIRSSYLITLFKKDLIVLAQGHAKYDGGYIFEAVNPFLTFTSLTSDIKHAVGAFVSMGQFP